MATRTAALAAYRPRQPSLRLGLEHVEARRLTIGAVFLPSLVTLGIGITVWLSADWFALRTFPVASTDSLNPDCVRGDTLLATALSIMGILFVAEGVPALVNGAALFVQSYTATRSILGRDIEQERLIWGASARAATAEGVARLAIGLVLMAGPARLSAAVTRIRKELRGTLEDDAPSQDKHTP